MPDALPDTTTDTATSTATNTATGTPDVRDLVEVHSYKYDGRINRRWQGRLVRRDGSLVVIEGVFDEEIRHPLLGTIVAGTRSVEFYWLDRWHSIFRFSEPDGRLRNYYGNINRPPEFDGRVLSFIDLDIDVLVAPDLSFRVVDEDEFEINAARFQYPSDVRRRTREALAELIALIAARAFPFDENA